MTHEQLRARPIFDFTTLFSRAQINFWSTLKLNWKLEACFAQASWTKVSKRNQFYLFLTFFSWKLNFSSDGRRKTLDIRLPFQFSRARPGSIPKSSAHLSCLVVVGFSRICMYKCNFIILIFFFNLFDIFTMKLESYLCEYFPRKQEIVFFPIHNKLRFPSPPRKQNFSLPCLSYSQWSLWFPSRKLLRFQAKA